MKFEHIPQALDKDDCIMINNGEVMIKKKLKCVIGGVSIYQIMVDFPKGRLEPLYFDTLDELDDWSLMNKKEQNLRRCIVCGEIPVAMEQFEQDKESGYFYDKEMNQHYCCEACRNKWFEQIYGKGNFKFEDGAFMGIDTYIRENSESEWEPYSIEFVMPYDFVDEN